MHTTETKRTRSWYDSPYGRLCEQAGHRRPQPSVADVMARLVGTSR
jgi:hypothetical protein